MEAAIMSQVSAHDNVMTLIGLIDGPCYTFGSKLGVFFFFGLCHHVRLAVWAWPARWVRGVCEAGARWG